MPFLETREESQWIAESFAKSIKNITDQQPCHEGRMTITLTREEAQSMLYALSKGIRRNDWKPVCDAHNEMKMRLAHPEPEYRDVVIKGDLWRVEFLPDHAASVVLVRANYEAQPEPEPVRLHRGDILRCIETNELCTVWATSTTGKTLVKWKANDFGEYTAEQIGDLFWIEPKSEPEPVAWMNESDIGRTDWKVWAHGKPTATMPLYTAPPQREWQGLTDEEIMEMLNYGQYGRVPEYARNFVDAIEAKLREKNA